MVRIHFHQLQLLFSLLLLFFLCCCCCFLFSKTLTPFWEKTPVNVVKEAKFLGLIFDTKFTLKNTVRYHKSSCQKALDILQVVGHTDWGADRIVSLRLYRALVRSKLDYRCIVY